MRVAFTMVELIFVILLLGILGVMTTDIITQTYRNYVDQREISDLQTRSKQVLNQLTDYLEDAIRPSAALFNGAAYADAWEAGVSDVNGTNYLVWIAKDSESLRGVWSDAHGRIYPGYSGVANVETSTQNTIRTPACDVSIIDAMQGDLVPDRPNWIDGADYRSVIYFVYANADGTVQERFWDWPAVSLFRISGVTGSDTINLADAPAQISDRYYLSYTAKGIHAVGEALYLYDDFRPWNAQTVTAAKSYILTENLESFEFWSESAGGLLRLKLCLNNGAGSLNGKIVFCREAAVLR